MKSALVFHLLLLAVPVYFVWSAFSYSPQARYIPLIIGTLVLFFQIGVILRELFPTLLRGADVSILTLATNDDPPPAEVADEPVLHGRRVAAMVIWMAFFFLLFSFLGSLPATFIFIFLFILISGRVPWWGALAVSAGMVVLVWGLFVAMMKFQLFEGVLFGGLVPPF
jgi:hypothetical protein